MAHGGAEDDLESQVRRRLQERKKLFTLRELSERTGVSTVVLHNFLSGRTVNAPTLRKILTWLDVESPEQQHELDRLLRQLLARVSPQRFAYVRGEVWEHIRSGIRDSNWEIPEWMERIPRAPRPDPTQETRPAGLPNDDPHSNWASSPDD